MKHIIICEYGLFLGVKSQRLTIKKSGELIQEISLSSVKTIQIMNKGVSFSSDLIWTCSVRGVKFFFLWVW